MFRKIISTIVLPFNPERNLTIHLEPFRFYDPNTLIKETEHALSFIYACLAENPSLVNKNKWHNPNITITHTSSLWHMAFMSLRQKNAIASYSGITKNIWLNETFHYLNKPRLLKSLIHENVHFLADIGVIPKNIDLWLARALETAHDCFTKRKSPYTQALEQIFQENTLTYDNAVIFLYLHDKKEHYNKGELAGELLGALDIIGRSPQEISNFILNVHETKSIKEGFLKTFNLSEE